MNMKLVFKDEGEEEAKTKKKEKKNQRVVQFTTSQ